MALYILIASSAMKCLSPRFTCLDAHSADVLSDVVLIAKLFEFLKTPEVIKLLRLLFDGTGRADGDALAALAA